MWKENGTARKKFALVYFNFLFIISFKIYLRNTLSVIASHEKRLLLIHRQKELWMSFCEDITAEKVSVFWFFLVRIFSDLDWIRRESSISPDSVQIRANMDQNNSGYGHFSRSTILQHFCENSYFFSKILHLKWLTGFWICVWYYIAYTVFISTNL